jgi:hypothetical protein
LRKQPNPYKLPNLVDLTWGEAEARENGIDRSEMTRLDQADRLNKSLPAGAR